MKTKIHTQELPLLIYYPYLATPYFFIIIYLFIYLFIYLLLYSSIERYEDLIYLLLLF